MFKILISGNKEIASIEFKIPDKKQNTKIIIELRGDNKKRDLYVLANSVINDFAFSGEVYVLGV